MTVILFNQQHAIAAAACYNTELLHCWQQCWLWPRPPSW